MRFKNKLFGLKVKEVRDECNWSLRRCAKVVGVSYATLSRIENGKMPDLISYMRICDKLFIDSKTYFY